MKFVASYANPPQVREFDCESRDKAIKMAKAYPGLCISIKEKAVQETVDAPETAIADMLSNRMIVPTTVAKRRTGRRRAKARK